MIRINDLFWTFQGEGYNCGRRALFIRLPFCNLKCSWCDTEFNTFSKMTEEEFKLKANEEISRFAVITGGEPSINKDVNLVIGWLKDLNFTIAIESNGCFKIPDRIDFVTISPKRDSDYLVNDYSIINDLKFVIDEGFDFSILDSAYLKVWDHTNLYLSPEFNNMEKSLKEIESYIKEHPRWRYSLQTHKWIGIK